VIEVKCPAAGDTAVLAGAAAAAAPVPGRSSTAAATLVCLIPTATSAGSPAPRGAEGKLGR
jgi:hypothetical protein